MAVIVTRDGEIQQKRSDTLTKDLFKTHPQFSPNATLGTSERKEPARSSEGKPVRRAAAKLKKK